MRVVLLSETYPKDMGYLVTLLPKYLARQGAEVHLIVLDLPPYHYLPDYRRTYSSFVDPRLPVAGSVEQVDGYTVHVLAHHRWIGYAAPAGLIAKLRELRPDVVYSSVAIGWLPLLALVGKWLLGYQLFTGSHTAAIMFPLANRRHPWLRPEGLACLLARWLPGRLVSLFTRICYAPTRDCGAVAARFFGVQRDKLRIVHLGVDHEVFHPRAPGDDAERAATRAELGIGPDEIVCIYTGKMTEWKNPLLVADAVAALRARARPYRGLFIGEGAQRDAIAARPDCVVLDLMPYRRLGRYFRAADVAVWPTNESTSMLDAAACGLPIVVSDRIYRDHVDGNGRVYRMNDLDDLVRVLDELGDPALRALLGAAGARKMSERFNWETIAADRLADLRQVLDPADAA